jgi:hypothetical protein
MAFFKINRIVVLITLMMMIAVGSRVPVDTDTWWHLRSAEHTLTEGMIYTDPFSHTYFGQRWINHSWGSQIVLYTLYSTLGNFGLSIFTPTLAVAGLCFIYPILKGNIYLKSFIIALGGITASLFWSERPAMFSFFFSAVTLFLLYRYKEKPSREIVILIPMMCLWGNLHAGYSIGFIFLGAFIGGEFLNKLFMAQHSMLTWRNWFTLVLVAILSAMVLVISPYGIETLLVPFQTVGIDALRAYIMEWQTPNFQQSSNWTILGMIFIAFAGAWLGRVRWDWTSYALFCGTVFMTMLYGRNVSVFAIASLPIISQFWDSFLTENNLVLRPRRETARNYALNIVLLGLVAFGLLVYLVGNIWNPVTVKEFQERFLPVKAVEYMNSHDLPPNLFNTYNWGGYLVQFARDYPVFIDGRTDLYGGFVDTYHDITLLRGDWEAKLREYKINVVLMESNTNLATALEINEEWELVYEDKEAVVFVRKEVIQ